MRLLRGFAAVALFSGVMVSDTPEPGVSRAAAAAQAPERGPTATLIPTATISFDSEADSNSPVVWELMQGQRMMFLFTSFNGWPTRHVGPEVRTLLQAGDVVFDGQPPHGVWLEAIVPDVDGTWYGYYHNELPATFCDDPLRTLPRLGAARSYDQGATWQDLGVILEAPPESHTCETTNRYFVGGVGDFSVILDQAQRYLYFFFSQYSEREQTQGVAVGRLPWAHRDSPRGRLAVWWRNMTWLPPHGHRMRREGMEFTYPAGTPIYQARDGWHQGRTVDAFWGPSVHWNTHLQRYVMLLNRAADSDWSQDGIYIAFSLSLDDPTSWTPPRRLLAGGNWYPQVVGLEPGEGTDRYAGEYARFFMSGRSRYLIRFER